MDKIVLPKVKLEKVASLSRDLFQLFMVYVNKTLTDEIIAGVERELSIALEDYTGRNVRQSLTQHLGTVLDEEMCKTVAWQFAARHRELKTGPLFMYERPSRVEWLPVEIHGMRLKKWDASTEGMEISLFCMGGHPAGHTIPRLFPIRWLSFLAYRIGYTRRMQYEHEPWQLLGLRFWGYLDHSESGEFKFSEYAVDARMLKENKLIIKRRTRFERDEDLDEEGSPGPGACPFQYEHSCLECRVTPIDCPASVANYPSCPTLQA